MVRKLLVLLAWTSLGYIVFVTLSPIGLRPIANHNPTYERLVAYAIVGMLFGLVYRGRSFMALAVVVGAAIALEGLQYLTPDRHGRLVDLLEKVSGGLLGVLVAIAAARYLAFPPRAITNERPHLARVKFSAEQSALRGGAKEDR